MTAMSGVTVDDKIKQAFDDMKHGGKKNRYIQMKITDDLKQVDIEKCAPKAETYADFVSQLPPNECRYAVVDYCYEGKETGPKDLLVLIVWCPDSAKVKEKMLYASTKEAVKQICTGVAAEIQANDFDGVSDDTVRDKVKNK